MLHHRLRAARRKASITFVDAGATSGGANPTVDVPTADLQAGDLLVLCVSVASTAPSTPSGWTLVAANEARNIARSYLYTKVAAGTETDFTLSSSRTETQCGVVHYRPVNGTLNTAYAVNNGSSTTASTTSQTIATLPALVVSHFCARQRSTNIGTVSGTNDRLLGTTSYTLLRVVDEFPTATGASGVRSATVSEEAWSTIAACFTLS